MINCSSRHEKFQCVINKECFRIFSDTDYESGGLEEGFLPHEILEAAIASSMNITIRKTALSENISINGVSTVVRLKMSEEQTIFNYNIEIRGDIKEVEKKHLEQAALESPIVKLLINKPQFSMSD